MQLRRKSSIILDRLSIETEEICIEDVDQEDWDFFDGLTTPRNFAKTRPTDSWSKVSQYEGKNSEVQQSIQKTVDSISQSQRFNNSNTEAMSHPTSKLKVEPYKAPSVVHRVAFEQVSGSFRENGPSSNAKLNSSPISSADVVDDADIASVLCWEKPSASSNDVSNGNQNSQTSLEDSFKSESFRKTIGSQVSNRNEEAQVSGGGVPSKISTPAKEDALFGTGQGTASTSPLPKGATMLEPPESPSEGFGAQNRRKRLLMKQINAQKFASPAMARIIAKGAEQIAEEEEAAEKKMA